MDSWMSSSYLLKVDGEYSNETFRLKGISAWRCLAMLPEINISSNHRLDLIIPNLLSDPVQ